MCNFTHPKYDRDKCYPLHANVSSLTLFIQNAGQYIISVNGNDGVWRRGLSYLGNHFQKGHSHTLLKYDTLSSTTKNTQTPWWLRMFTSPWDPCQNRLSDGGRENKPHTAWQEPICHQVSEQPVNFYQSRKDKGVKLFQSECIKLRFI